MIQILRKTTQDRKFMLVFNRVKMSVLPKSMLTGNRIVSATATKCENPNGIG